MPSLFSIVPGTDYDRASMVRQVLEEVSATPGKADVLSDYVARFSRRKIDTPGEWYAALFERELVLRARNVYEKLVETVYDRKGKNLRVVFKGNLTDTDLNTLRSNLGEVFEFTVVAAPGSRDSAGEVSELAVLEAVPQVAVPQVAPQHPKLPSTAAEYQDVLRAGGVGAVVFEAVGVDHHAGQVLDGLGCLWESASGESWSPVTGTPDTIELRTRKGDYTFSADLDKAAVRLGESARCFVCEDGVWLADSRTWDRALIVEGVVIQGTPAMLKRLRKDT